MFDAYPVHPKGTMVIPMLWRISEYVVCMMGVQAEPTGAMYPASLRVLGARCSATCARLFFG